MTKDCSCEIILTHFDGYEVSEQTVAIESSYRAARAKVDAIISQGNYDWQWSGDWFCEEHDWYDPDIYRCIEILPIPTEMEAHGVNS